MKKWLPEELEEIPCDFCGTREVAREFIRKDGMRVVECAQCGLAYLNPRPKPSFIPRFYEADYFTGVAAERGEGGLNCCIDPDAQQSGAEQAATPRAMIIINEKFGGFKGKNVLEIGCATGDLLIQIKNVGARARGLEISDFAADIARKRGLDVTAGTIEAFVQETDDKFDIVIALEVIEHVLSPTFFFELVARIIRPGGLLILSTPNYACVKRFGKHWLGFNMSFEHIYFYSLVVLIKITSKCGLRLSYVESSKSLGASQSFGFIRRQITRLRTVSFFVREIGLLGAIKSFLSRSKGYYPYAIGHTTIAVYEKTA